MSFAALNPNYFSKSAEAQRQTVCACCDKRIYKDDGYKVDVYRSLICKECRDDILESMKKSPITLTASRGVTYNTSTGHFTVRVCNTNCGTYNTIDEAKAAYNAVKLYNKEIGQKEVNETVEYIIGGIKTELFKS